MMWQDPEDEGIPSDRPRDRCPTLLVTVTKHLTRSNSEGGRVSLEPKSKGMQSMAVDKTLPQESGIYQLYYTTIHKAEG